MTSIRLSDGKVHVDDHLPYSDLSSFRHYRFLLLRS